MLESLLIALLALAAVIYIVRAHRKRATERAAASSKRFAEIFGAASQSAGWSKATAVAAGAAMVHGSGAPASAGRTPAPYLRKERLLDPRHASLFHLLTSSLPEHRIFIHVSLAAVIEVPPSVQGREREQRWRVLAQNAVDCLVCTGELDVIAAVDLETGNGAEARIKAEYLKAAQLRYLLVSPSALPRPEEMRTLLLGRAG